MAQASGSSEQIEPGLRHPRQEFVAGIAATSSFIIGAIPFGVIFGAVGTAQGLSLVEVISLSLFVFSGSAQFVAISLIAAGAGPLAIWAATLILNLRHVLYAASLVGYVRHLSFGWRVVLSALLTDETFSAMEDRYRRLGCQPNSHWAYLGSCLSMYANWNFWTAMGATLGSEFEGLAGSGLEFAAIAAFIGMVVPRLTSRPAVAAALTAAVVSIVGADLPYNLGLTLAAILGIAVAVGVELKHQPQRQTA